MSARKSDRRRKQDKAWARESAKKEACRAKSAAAPKRAPSDCTAKNQPSEELIRRFDELLDSLGEPADRYFASRHSLSHCTQGAFRGMDDYRAEMGALMREWLWKMRLAEVPHVLRGRHGTAVGFTFDIKTEDGSFSTDFGLYLDLDGTLDTVAHDAAFCLSWNDGFRASYGFEDRLRRAHMAMAMRLLDAYGLRLTA